MSYTLTTMNWLVISNLDSEIQEVLQFLKINNADCKSLIIGDDYIKNDLSSFDYDKINQFLEKLYDASHCILIGNKALFHSKLILFSQGYLIGKKIPLFISGIESDYVNKLNLTSTKVFTSTKDLINCLNEDFPGYLIEEEKRKALLELFERGIPFTPDCFSFHIAKNNEAECQMFFDAGMDVNSRDSAGTPMICVAARSGKKEMIQWLIDHGADIDAVSQDRGYSAVMDAVWKSNREIVDLLVKLGANLNFIGRDGQSVLVLATGTGNTKICEILVRNGADPTITDHMGMSALEYAKLFKKDTLVSLYEEYVK